jgi:hypothetical protein
MANLEGPGLFFLAKIREIRLHLCHPWWIEL